MPLPFEKFEPKLHFIKQDKEVQILRVSPNTYELKADFGYINFLDITREINSVFLKSPSEHTVEGVQFALEMQVYAMGDKNTPGLVVSKLFELGKEVNADLTSLGFGSKTLKGLKVGASKSISEPISLESLVGDSQAFINYQAETTTGNCEMVEWLISVETG